MLGEFVDVWAVYRLIVNGEVHTERAGRWVDWATGNARWIDAGGNDLEHRGEETEDGDTVVSERVFTHWQPLPPPPLDENDR